MADDWSPKGTKKAEAAKGLKLPDPSPHKDAFLKGRLADRIDDGTGQRDALKKLINNPCENAFELSNWNTRYSLNRNSYSMDQLFDLVATGFTAGCSQNADVISAGLVQGLNYDYTPFDNGGSNLVLSNTGGNAAISGASCTLDCDGSYPVLAIFGCVAQAGTSDIVEFNIGINGDVGDNTDDTYRWRIGYLSGDGKVIGTSYACMIDSSEIPAGSNTFQVGYATAGVNNGTLYFSGVNTAFFMVIELKTVEGQITQAKVDNRTQHLLQTITDWNDKPSNPTDTEVIVFEPTSGVRWQMQFDEANDRWNFVGGPDWIDFDDTTRTATATVPTQIPSSTISIPVPATGRYACTHSAGVSATATSISAYVSAGGAVSPAPVFQDASIQFNSSTAIGAIWMNGRTREHNVTSTTNPFVLDCWSSGANTVTLYRTQLGIHPLYLDN